MKNILATAAIGLGAGLLASFVMDRYQAATAGAFGMDEGDDDPATVKAADTVSKAAGAGRIPNKDRAATGSVVHYATGAVMGVGYALAARRWPIVAAGFGLPFGLATAAVLDDTVVPAMGWGGWPWEGGVASNAYSVSSHLVFAGVLDGTRRLALGSFD